MAKNVILKDVDGNELQVKENQVIKDLKITDFSNSDAEFTYDDNYSSDAICLNVGSDYVKEYSDISININNVKTNCKINFINNTVERNITLTISNNIGVTNENTTVYIGDVQYLDGGNSSFLILIPQERSFFIESYRWNENHIWKLLNYTDIGEK